MCSYGVEIPQRNGIYGAVGLYAIADNIFTNAFGIAIGGLGLKSWGLFSSGEHLRLSIYSTGRGEYLSLIHI